MLAVVLIAATVLLRLDPAELVIYPDTRQGLEAPDTLVAEAACPYLRSTQVPLPVPYVIQLFKSSGEGGAESPDPSKHVSGMLRACPDDPTTAAHTTPHATPHTTQ